MGRHLGWHFAVCCPLRGGRGEFTIKTPKTIKEQKKICVYQKLQWNYLCMVPILMYCLLELASLSDFTSISIFFSEAAQCRCNSLKGLPMRFSEHFLLWGTKTVLFKRL
jgi:hypothetical protein